MKYAVTIGCVIYSLHNKKSAATKRMMKIQTLFPEYPFRIRELLPKGERPGWEVGDNPSPRNWPT